jgi:hypothetical protein
MMIGKAKRDVMRAQELINIVVVPLPARQHVKEERQTLTVLGKLRRKLEQYDPNLGGQRLQSRLHQL